MILYIFFKKQFRCFILQAQCFPDSFKSFTFPIIPKFPTDDWLMEYDISIPPMVSIISTTGPRSPGTASPRPTDTSWRWLPGNSSQTGLRSASTSFDTKSA